MDSLTYLIILIGIFYFVLFRPQQKQRKQRQEMINSLEVGKKIVTIGGIHGEILSLGEETANLKIAENAEIVLQKTAIGFVVKDKESEIEEEEDEEETSLIPEETQTEAEEDSEK